MSIRDAILGAITLIAVCWYHGNAEAAVTQEQLSVPALCGSLGEVRNLVENTPGSKFVARGRLDNGNLILYYINVKGPALQILYPLGGGEWCLLHNVRVNRLEVNRSGALSLFVD